MAFQTNNYIPYRTTKPMGDVLREGDYRLNAGLTKLYNYMSYRYARDTEYTQQNYSTRNTFTKQTLAPPVKKIGEDMRMPDYLSMTSNIPKASVKVKSSTP